MSDPNPIAMAVAIADLDRIPSSIRLAIRLLVAADPVPPDDPLTPSPARLAAVSLHEAITRAEDTLRTIRESFPIP